MKKTTLRCALFTAVLVPVFLFSGCATRSKRTSSVPRVVAPTPAPIAVVEEASVQAADVATNLFPSVPEPERVVLSVGTAEIVKLAQAGMNEKVMMAFVENYDSSFEVTAPSIVYMGDLGIPEAVIAAMIRHHSAGEPSVQNDHDKAGASEIGNSSVEVAAVPEAGTEQPANANREMEPVPAGEAPSVSVTATPEFEAGVAPLPQVELDSPTPVQSNYFYSTLEPYGRWVDVPGYGVCWQPTAAAVNTSWQPYLDNGRWVSSSAGWYWHSNYSWGWAPFHYGRWHRHSVRGWVWIPGSVWGPAWVTWRYSDSYVGWAPLPPGARYYDGFGLGFRAGSVGIGFDFGLSYADYGFVPFNYFYGPAPWRHRLPHARGRDIYHRTTIINNYTQAPDHSIVHHGPSRTPGSTFRQSGIRTVTLQDLPLNHPSDARPGQMSRHGSEVVVYRPEASAWRAGSSVVGRRESLRVSSPAETVTQTGDSAPVARRMVGPRGASASRSQEVTPRLPAAGSTASYPIRRRESARPESIPSAIDGGASVAPLQRRERFGLGSESLNQGASARTAPNGFAPASETAESIRLRRIQSQALEANRASELSGFNSRIGGREQIQTRGTGRELTQPQVSGFQANPAVSEGVPTRIYSPPSRFDAPRTQPNFGAPNINRGFPGGGTIQTPPAGGLPAPNIRTTPMPERPPPIQIQPSQLTPSTRPPGGSPPSRTGGSSRGRRSE